MNNTFTRIAALISLTSVLALSAACDPGPSLADLEGCVFHYTENYDLEGAADSSSTMSLWDCQGIDVSDLHFEATLGGEPFTNETNRSTDFFQPGPFHFYKIEDIHELTKEVVISDGEHRVVFRTNAVRIYPGDEAPRVDRFTLCDENTLEGDYRQSWYNDDGTFNREDVIEKCAYLEAIDE